MHYGKGIAKNERKPNGRYPVYGANGELARTDKFLVEGDALIIGRKGSAGEVTRVSGKFWPSDVTYYVFGNDQVDINYLFYVLKRIDLRQLATGIKPGINRNRVYELKIPLPPLPEQKRIVAKIEELFEKIDEAKKLREQALEQTNSLLSAALAEVFERGKKEGWVWKKLGEICHINPRKTEVNKLPDDLEISFVPMSAVSEETGTIAELKIRKLGEVRKGYTYFKEGDVLFAKITPCMENGKSAIATNLLNGIGFGSTEFHVLRPTEMIQAKLVHFFIRQKSFKEEAVKYFTGTAGQQRVPEEFLQNAYMLVPPVSEQNRIIKHLDAIQSQAEPIKQLQSETQRELDELKKSILDKAFKGELMEDLKEFIRD